MSAESSAQSNIIKVVEGHVEQLIAEHKSLVERNRDLVEQCDKLRTQRRELQQRVVELERELSRESLASALSADGTIASLEAARGRQRARAYINRLMREIDACITYMTSPEGGGGE